ncbi:ABC transporter transmembrane domain-containing protein [Iodidimonas sp. SYSU 1G8]|uniref:ABC transporter transmembrane domain-containing protein n=1 Tax=Iodidimonas sp. SYSU 1G8 TaxID=3133967 RepID=UPI0031FED43E
MTEKDPQAEILSPVFARAGKRDLGQLRFLLRFVQPYRALVASAVVALVIGVAAVMAFGPAMRRMVDMGFDMANQPNVNWYFLGVFGVVVVLAAATAVRFALVSWLGERVVADMRAAVYGHVISLSPTFFTENRSGEIASRLTADTTLIQSVVGSSLSVALRGMLTVVGGLIALGLTNLKLTLLVLLAVPLVLAPIMLIGKKVRNLSRASQDRIADIGAMVTEGFGATQTIQAFTHEAADRDAFNRVGEGAFATAVRRIKARAWLTFLVILLAVGVIDLVLWIGAHDVMAGRMTNGELAQFVFFSVMVAGSVIGVSESYGEMLRAAGAAGRMMELLQVEPGIKAPADPVALPQPPRGEVAFENVTFHYPSRPNAPALEGLSFAVRAGETVALVGPSGAGKSTVFQLLLRFYDPEQGSVRVDGVDLRQADPGAVRGRMGIVPQDTMIFAASALENIRYGRPGATDAEVRAAIQAAAADEFLGALPQGLDTQLGERGVKLSGGQRQRIAIARAILRDPPILLLDEATSALDAQSEQVVQTALERLMQNRTTIVIAHRLATVLKADRILVIDGGRLVDEGTHQELQAKGGLYASLAELQFGAGPERRLSVIGG